MIDSDSDDDRKATKRIRHPDYRQYYDQSGELCTSRQLQNTYYHPRLTCISQKYPYFVASMIKVGAAVASQMTSSHKEHLQKEFGLLF